MSSTLSRQNLERGRRMRGLNKEGNEGDFLERESWLESEREMGD